MPNNTEQALDINKRTRFAEPSHLMEFIYRLHVID